MQYTIRQVPKAVDKALRQKAKREKKSLNQFVVESLARTAGVDDKSGKPKRDITFMGKMDDETAKAIEDAHAWFDRVWPEDNGK